MERIIRNLLFSIFICIVTTSLIFASFGLAQEKKADTQKLYEEIAGYYEFYSPDQTQYVTFWVEDGVLKAKENNDDDIVELVPIEGKELSFEVTTSDGQVIELHFSRDEEGKITKCLAITMGIEIEGIKIKK